MKAIKIIYSIIISLPALVSFPGVAQQNEFNVKVSNGPFTKELVITEKQSNYSPWWKENAKEQLSNPVNFAGHFRLFVSKGGHGEECIHDYWVCGWVIDKITGKVVSTLPVSPEGGDSYAEAVDNGTVEGAKFDYTAEKDSTALIIKGRAVNAPLRDEQGNFSVPECRLIKYNFNGVGFDLVKEEDNGCNLQKEKEVYGY